MKKTKNKIYPAWYLAAILAAILLLEGILLGVATPSAWQRGLEILDVSSAVQTAMADAYWAIEPLVDQAASVNKFYEVAASEAMVLFDASKSDPFVIVDGVNEFYRLASIQMEQLLDLSQEFSYLPQVAGAYVSK